MEKETADDTDFETKYPGGKSGRLAWESAVEERTYNQPIFKALWENDEDKIKEMEAVPEWQQGWDTGKNKEKWAEVSKYAKEFFPITFCSKPKNQQLSMAAILKPMVANMRTKWWRILRASTCDAALIHVRRLRPSTLVQQMRGSNEH